MQEPKESARAYVKGQEVSGRVVNVLPYGVFIHLEDGVEAYVRRREMSWAGDVDPRELVSLGAVLRGVVVDLGQPDRCIELSHKATLPDPWDEFVSLYETGDVIQGTARKVTEFGVFVQVLPGVDGLVPTQALAPWPGDRAEDQVWVGDDVEAVITSINPSAREIQLSICSRLRQRAKVEAVWERIYASTDRMAHTEDGPSHGADGGTGIQTMDPSLARHIGRVLVVEDDPQVRLPLREWFRKLGFAADAAEDAEEAQTSIRQRTYGLLLLDIQLPGEDSLAFLRSLRDQRARKIPVALMSTPECIRQRAAEIEKLNVLEVFPKPLAPEKIVWFLYRLASREPMVSWRATSDNHSPESEPQAFKFDGVSIPLSPGGHFPAILDHLRVDTEADAAAIFYLDPDSAGITVLATAGTIQQIPETKAAHHLYESPVRDVIVEGEPVFENGVDGTVRARFQKLLALIPFQSCIGVPVRVRDATNHAVFLFARDGNAFSRYRLRDAQAGAVLISTVIERDMLNRQIQSHGGLLVSGQLMAGLGHELCNKVSGLEIQLRNLSRDWQELELSGPVSQNPLDCGEFSQAVATLVDTAGELRHTTEVFQRLMRAEGDHVLDVNNVVRTSRILLRPVARRAGVKVVTKLGPDLPPVIGSQARLQQVFLNLMLNAVQQMELINRQGMLRVVTSLEPFGDLRPIKVRFFDGGPGIHKKLQEKIFGMGHSTRPGGAGLGLFIARSLVQSMGGAILLEESLVPLGTTFLVELPAAVGTTPVSGTDEGGADL